MNFRLRILIVSGILLCGGCLDEIIEEHSRNKLVIWGEAPPEGKVGEPYTFRLGARVENTPLDHRYDFHFTLGDGTIPPGTEFENYEEDGVDYARVTGIPTAAGSYTFAVEVRSEKLKREKETERREEREDPFSWTSTRDVDEELFTIYILER